MPKQPGFWRVEDRLDELSPQGDPLWELLEIVDFELFRPILWGEGCFCVWLRVVFRMI